MARPLDQEKKEKLLSTALRLFVANGVLNTSTAEIAKEAGMAAGTLFLYFPTKQDLIHELVLKISREQSQAMNELLSPELSAHDMLLTIWNGSIGWFKDHPDAFQYVQQIRDSGMIANSIVQESNQSFGYYYTAIQKGLAENSIKPYPPELIGGMLYQQVVAVMNLIRFQPDPDRQTDYIQQGFEIFWNGIKQTSARE